MIKQRLKKAKAVCIILLSAFFFTLSCNRTQHISLWERHCESCHDGKTILNGKVVINHEQMTAKYRTLDKFKNACAGAPSCMNILKHEEKLFLDVGKELGLK